MDLSTPDASTNIVPLGILIGGEELHNNHHAYPTSAKLSMKWYEFDIGWLYIRLLEAVRMARVKHTAPTLRLVAAKPAVDPQTLQAIIACRYAVLAQYGRSVRRVYREELAKPMYAMRPELAAVWGRSTATRDQLVAQLQDWCRRAETTEIKPLAEFSRQLRSYA